MRSVELFTGAGGLALGIAAAGFRHDVVVEWNHDACATIRANQRRGVWPVVEWPLLQADVRTVDYSFVKSGLDLVAGGPPCQPFSLGGKHRGHSDHRDMFPEAVRAIRELAPKAFIFENVKGLRRQAFERYFSYIILQLTHPELVPRPDEIWTDHRARLEEHHTSGTWGGLRYNVVFQTVNAADYGVPQRRERVFIVGFREDLRIEWSFPRPLFSHDALLWDQWVTGEYWERHGVPADERPEPSPMTRDRIRRLRGQFRLFASEPWRTVRDAISDLPDPRMAEAAEVPNHSFIPGARRYHGHTGSPLDEPAKTLKAGDHGVPGGENTVVMLDGKVRYFTVRETARLQTFPDSYVFQGSWSEIMRQLGNAVPLVLARDIAISVKDALTAAVA